MHTLGDMAKALNRSAVYLHGVQARFELPTIAGSGYPEAYLSFLRTVVFLRMLNVSEESLRDLWHIEKKLLQLPSTSIPPARPRGSLMPAARQPTLPAVYSSPV